MIILREKSLARQDEKINEKLKNSKVVIFGLGGLGSNIALLLAKSGVKNLYLVDYDKVEYSNLNRQIYGTEDIGKYKAEACKEILERLVPYGHFESFNEYVDASNIGDFLDMADIFVEAFDSVESKTFLFEEFLGVEGKFLVSGSGIGGLEAFDTSKYMKFSNVFVFGDFVSPETEGLYYPKVMLCAAAQSLKVLNLINNKGD